MDDVDGAGLKAWRDAHGLTMAQLGDKLGVPVNTVYRWELHGADKEAKKHRVGIRHGRILALALWALEIEAGAAAGASDAECSGADWAIGFERGYRDGWGAGYRAMALERGAGEDEGDG